MGNKLSWQNAQEAGSSSASAKLPVVCGEEVMSAKAHGTTATAVQESLRWSCKRETADKICSYNRHYAEHSGYWKETTFFRDVKAEGLDQEGKTITFYDSVSGAPLFTAPKDRTFADFVRESEAHGWPSFRDAEVHWEHVRCLKNGEAVSTVGTHLGHNLPDRNGNRYCINLVSVAGAPNDAE